jgi:hypothetical protein
MRTMNPPLHPLLLEIAHLANVTPQEALERIASEELLSVLDEVCGLVECSRGDAFKLIADSILAA